MEKCKWNMVKEGEFGSDLIRLLEIWGVFSIEDP